MGTGGWNDLWISSKDLKFEFLFFLHGVWASALLPKSHTPFQHRGGHICIRLCLCKLHLWKLKCALYIFLLTFLLFFFFFTCTEIISHCVINCADPGLLKYVGPDCKPLAYLVPLKVSGIEKLCCTPVGSGSSMQPTDLCVNQLAQIIDFFIQSHSSTLLPCHSEFVVMNDMSTYILIVSLPEPTALVQ